MSHLTLFDFTFRPISAGELVPFRLASFHSPALWGPISKIDICLRVWMTLIKIRVSHEFTRIIKMIPFSIQ